MADVEVQRPAMEASGDEVDDMFVGSLFHSLMPQEKKERKRDRCYALARRKCSAIRFMGPLRWNYRSIVMST